VYMDAYAKDGHVAMIYTLASSSSGTDFIIEAIGKPVDPPVRKAYVDYRGQSAFEAVRRENWTPDCYPQCSAPIRGGPVVAVS
jgi:hypothetical protein